MMTELREKRLFLLDMDGTIYLDETLFPGTLPFLEAVRAAGGRCLFLTNNSSKSVDAYIAKLARLGVPSLREDFLTSWTPLSPTWRPVRPAASAMSSVRPVSAASWRRPAWR